MHHYFLCNYTVISNLIAWGFCHAANQEAAFHLINCSWVRDFYSQFAQGIKYFINSLGTEDAYLELWEQLILHIFKHKEVNDVETLNFPNFADRRFSFEQYCLLNFWICSIFTTGKLKSMKKATFKRKIKKAGFVYILNWLGKNY